MVFSSMVFLCIFLPVVFLLHLILPGIRDVYKRQTLGYEDFYTYWFRAKNVTGTQNEIS